MPLVLGFNCTHDACAVLLRDGEVVLAVEEERLSRVKHHFGMPLRAIRACLDEAGVSIGDVEHAALYMEPGLWLRSFGFHFARNLPGSLAFTGRKPALWKSFLGVERRFRRETGFTGCFHAVEHHAAHADSAFFPSGFGSAASMTVDGAGEHVTTLLAAVDGSRIRRIADARYPFSIGKVWEAVTDWLGWRATQDEGKLMGLAPYGTPRFVEPFRAVFAAADEGDPRLFHMDLRWFDFPRGRTRLVSRRFVEAFGPPRAPDGPVEDWHRDVAFALQRRTEEAVLAMARRVRRETGLPRLVMAGGVALNCVANGRLVREGIFDEVFVQPAAGDNGASLGAALHVAHRRLGIPRGAPMRHAFLGPGFTEADTDRAAAERGLTADSAPDVVERTAELLAGGAIVGWMQGRMEYGPRALGNRSILADPSRPGMKDHVNARVKFREGFRPFAPSVPLDRAAEWFEDVRPSPYMLLAFRVKAEQLARLPAVTHVDGTARVQTVTPEENPRFHALLGAFGRRTGVPVLLNTSFNVRGEPIVRAPAEALDALLRTGLDAVVIGDRIFRK
ncbi:MAG: Decarbamoylnovobiocin carbamoyltransferase [Planctomycetes bacterium]|nr:Decarbamoylnovobiocin carbamoyltransferase [Planctomycetota bacterium]